MFSLLFLLGLHGSSIIKVIAILSVNFLVAKLCKSSKIGPVLTWTFNIGILFLNDRYSGYRFGELHQSLEYLVCESHRYIYHFLIVVILKDQEKYTGFYPRWHVNFNIIMLRLVSFNMDYYWACRQIGPTEVRVRYLCWFVRNDRKLAQTVASLNEKQRQTTSHPEEMYSFLNYIAYTLYPPLYITGPIMTFNDFVWQVRPILLTANV